MPEPEKSPDAEILRRARRVLWACGLCFALLFLMGLTGIASITLLYDDPMMRTNMRGFEGDVVRFVASIGGLIHMIHEWGGYVGIVLSGWAGLEIFSFGRLLRRTDKPDWRASGGRLMPLGVAGAALLITALLLLIPSGVAARMYLINETPPVVDDTSNPERVQPRIPGTVEFEDAGDSGQVDWHTKQLNYLLAIGAILLLFGVSSTRRIQLEVKKAAKAQA
jgi:hypothetical protein